MNSVNEGGHERSIWRFQAVGKQLTEARTFVELAQFAGGASIELYKPVGEDKQSPHDRDELYIIASGSGNFTLQEKQFSFAQGDAIFVPAYAEHRFSEFSEDFSTWVVFFGPVQSAP